MDRMIILCLAVFCGAFIGIYLSRRLQDRYIFLIEMDALVLKMVGYIKYNRYSVCELLSKSRNDRIPIITDDMISVSGEGKRIDKMWREELSKIKYLS